MKLARSAAREGRGDVSTRFTGNVQIAAPFGKSGSHQGARFAFHPGARTAWHAHPIGQTLLVIEGAGSMQRAGGHIESMRPGDIVWLEPVTLIALARAEADADVVWMEQVTEDEYRGTRDTVEASDN
jgi:quercetin dioxygenase-like cupin family protein